MFPAWKSDAPPPPFSSESDSAAIDEGRSPKKEAYFFYFFFRAGEHGYSPLLLFAEEKYLLKSVRTSFRSLAAAAAFVHLSTEEEGVSEFRVFAGCGKKNNLARDSPKLL